MTRLRTLLWLVFLCAGALYMLFQVKFEVQALEKQLKALNAQIYNNQQAIHVLTAEWSHLNEPARLSELNERYLHLVPVDAKQLARLEDLPPRIRVPDEFAPVSQGLQAMAPAAGGSLPEVAPVTRNAPKLASTDPRAAELRPTVASAIASTFARLVGTDEGGSE